MLYRTVLCLASVLLVAIPTLLTLGSLLHLDMLSLRVCARALGFVFTVLVVPASVYVRKPQLRRFLWREAKEMIRR